MVTKLIKVLAVDDEQLLLWALEKAGKARFLDIKTAVTTDQALQEITNRHYDLFLLDFDMRDTNRLELLQAIDECCPYVPIIIMTTSDTRSRELNDTIRGARKNGAWHLLEKPFSLDKLISLVEMIFKGYNNVKVRLNSLTHNYDNERRNKIRRPHVQSVAFSYNTVVDGVETRVKSSGILTDISENGSCLLAHEQLQPNQVIRFEDPSIQHCGAISWSVILEEKTYRCGLRFC